MSGAPGVNLGLAQGGARLSPSAIDRRFAAPASNVDLSGMQPAANANGSTAAPANNATQPAPAAVAPMRVVPAHFDNSRVPIRSSTLQAEQHLQGDEIRDAEAMDRAQQSQAVIQANALQQQADDAQTQLYARQATEMDRQRQVAAARAQATAAVDDVAKKKIDPNQAYGNSSLGTQLSLAVAGAMGGILAARTGGRNTFLDTMQTVIQNNMDAQKANLANAKDVANMRQNQLGSLMAQFGDDRQAENVFRQQQYAIAANQVQAQMAKSDLPIVQARGQQALDAIAQKQLELQKQYDQAAYVKAYTVGGTATGSGEKPDDLFVPTGPNGQGFRARTTDEAKDARIVATVRQQAAPIIAQLQQLRAKTNGAERAAGKMVGYQSPELAKIESLQNQLTTIVKPLEQVRTLSDSVQQSSKDLAGDWSRVTGHPEAAAETFLTGLDNRLDAVERGQGGQGVRNTLGVDAHGNIVQRSIGQASQADSRADVRTDNGRAHVAKDKAQSRAKVLEDFRRKTTGDR